MLSNNFFIWRIFFICFLFSLSSQQNCQTLPLSVSSLNICEDGNCRTTETAQLRLGLTKGTTECVRIESTGSQVLPSVFNITIVDSVLSYPLVDCYFSDDPQFDVTGFCGCPGGTTVSCDICPSAIPSGDTNICTTGLHNSKGCLLGGAGTWCTQVGFSGINRFKICDIGDPELQISFEYFDTNSNKIHSVTNPTVVTLSNSVFNLTLIDPSVKDKEKTEFMVWDLTQKQNFFLIPERYVNFDNTYDPTKLGWFKTNKTKQVTNDFFKSTNIQITSCSQNTFQMGTSAVFATEFLTNHPEYCAQRVAPGSILRDPGFGLVSAMTGETIINPVDLIQGAYFLSIDGEVVPVGIDLNDEAYPGPVWWSANGWTIDTNIGTQTGDFFCSNGTALWRDAVLSTQIVTCQSQTNSKVWGPCLVATDPSDSTTQYICTDIAFVAYAWPGGGLQSWQFNSSGFIQTSNNVPDVVERSDALLVPVKEGSITALLEFKNVTFTFNTINAIPHIDSINDDNGDLIIVASSKTVPGNCVLMISDDLGPTVSVFLALVNNKYRLPITRKRFDGEAIITLQCFKNKDVVSFKVEVDKGDPDVNEKTINSTSVRKASTDEPSIWKRFISSASKTGDFFGNVFSTLFDLTSNKIGSFFLGLLIVISVIAAIPLSIWILWMILKRIYHMIRYRKFMPKSVVNDNSINFKAKLQ